MKEVRPSLRVAIVQQPMSWTTGANLAHILWALEIAARQRAALAVFPELALTGFHRGIREQGTPEIVAPALHQVRNACRERRIACALGLPTFAADGRVLNSHGLIDSNGRIIADTTKEGLTPAEATFFARGSQRPVVLLGGLACATVICREIEDLEPIVLQLAGNAIDVVLWPGLVGPFEGATDILAFGTEASALARRLGAFVVQSNWPQALNKPEATQLGLSRVVDPDGQMRLQLPADQAGVGVFDLGRRDCHWTRWPA